MLNSQPGGCLNAWDRILRLVNDAKFLANYYLLDGHLAAVALL